MAKENPLLVTDRPHQLFADAPPSLAMGAQIPPPAPPIAQPTVLNPTPLMGAMGMAPPMGMNINPLMQLSTGQNSIVL